MPDPWERPTTLLAPSPTPDPWERPPLGETRPAPAGTKTAEGVLESVQAGYQGGAPGLIIRGKLPDIVLDPHHAKWYETLSATVGQVVSELPLMIAGGAAGTAAGAPGGPIGSLLAAGAGTFGVPTLIRESLIQAYESGQVNSSGDFLSRVGIVISRTAKDSLVGAATFGAGYAAKVGAKVFGPVAAESANLTAQAATMTVAPAALDGRLPEPDDFLNAAIMVVGGKAAYLATGKIRAIYARTGIEPMQVVADAAREPKIAEQLKAETPDIPDAYKEVAAEQTARDAVPMEKAAQVKESPFAPLPDQSAGVKSTDINFKYINASEDAMATMARLSQVYETEIQTQRTGTQTWPVQRAETQKFLESLAEDPIAAREFLNRVPGTSAGWREIRARAELTVQATEELGRASRAFAEKAGDVTPTETLEYLATIERAGMIQAASIGARSEPGRAMQAMKDSKRAADAAKYAQEVIATYKHDPVTLAKMLSQLDTPEGTLRFARAIQKATTWEKIVEAYKVGLISTPTSHLGNLLGNTTFAYLRIPIDALAAGISAARGRAPGEGVHILEPFARAVGLFHGTLDALTILRGMANIPALKKWVFEPPSVSTTDKAEVRRQAIEGTKGEVLRVPFKLLAGGDLPFVLMGERAEAWTLAVRQAVKEGHHPKTREFRERVAELSQRPLEQHQAEIKAAGQRFTFNLPIGSKGQTIAKIVKAWHLELFVPFIKFPGNNMKEVTRMTPLAPSIAEWRADIMKGGAAADKAVAEMFFGSLVMAAVTSLVMAGKISGEGAADPSEGRVRRAAGEQPYSVDVRKTWYGFNRIQPVGTLVGMAADMGEVWKHMTPEEKDKIPKMLSMAFANAVTNQTSLHGLTNILQVAADTERYGARFIEDLAGSVVPGLVSYTARTLDPLEREIDGALEAVKSRIPGVREALPVKRDVFGEPIERAERILGVIPVSPVSTDPVRLEAVRLKIGVAKTPDFVSLPAAGDRKIGKVPLTPEERDIFASTAGKKAHELLLPIVSDPSWHTLSDFQQTRIYDRVFKKAREVGVSKAISPERLQEEINRIADEIAERLVP